MEKKEIRICYPTHTATHPVWKSVERSIYDMKEKDVPNGVNVYRPWAVCGPYLMYGYGFGYNMSEKVWFGNPSWYEQYPNWPNR
jgi:hypothetical protein